MAKRIVSIPHKFRLAGAISFRKDYSPPSSPPSRPYIRTLNNSVRTMLIHASMPPKYWAEALAAATYLLNRRPSSSIRNEIPYSSVQVPSFL